MSKGRKVRLIIFILLIVIISQYVVTYKVSSTYVQKILYKNAQLF